MATKKPIRNIKTALTTPIETPLTTPTEAPKEEVIEAPADMLEVNSDGVNSLQGQNIDKIIHVSEGITFADLRRLNQSRQKKTERLNIALTPALKEELQLTASIAGDSMNNIICSVLEEGLKGIREKAEKGLY